QNAGFAHDQRTVVFARMEPEGVISLLGAIDEAAILRNGLSPDDRYRILRRRVAQLRLMPVPDERPGRDLVAVSAEPVRHGSEPVDEARLLTRAGKDPRRRRRVVRESELAEAGNLRGSSLERGDMADLDRSPATILPKCRERCFLQSVGKHALSVFDELD